MNDKIVRTPVVCLFCGSELTIAEGETPQSGDLIRCHECSEDNDYDSVMKIATDKAMAQMVDELESDIKEMFKPR